MLARCTFCDRLSNQSLTKLKADKHNGSAVHNEYPVATGSVCLVNVTNLPLACIFTYLFFFLRLPY